MSIYFVLIFNEMVLLTVKYVCYAVKTIKCVITIVLAYSKTIHFFSEELALDQLNTDNSTTYTMYNLK